MQLASELISFTVTFLLQIVSIKWFKTIVAFTTGKKYKYANKIIFVTVMSCMLGSALAVALVD